MALLLITFELLMAWEIGKIDVLRINVTRTEVEVIKLNLAKIYRFLQLLSHSLGFFARV